MTIPTKASQIMALAAQGHTTRVIAGIVYGLSDDNDPQLVWERRMAYVRVVARQRKGAYSAADKAYLSVPANLERKRFTVRSRNHWRYQNDPAYRAYQNEKGRQWREKQRAHPARIT